MNFEIMSSNTGQLDVCALLQQKLWRPLFHLACHYHILELVAEAAFTTSFGPSSSPDIARFKRFQSSWNFIDQSKFEPLLPGDLDSELAVIFLSSKEQVVLFGVQNLQSAQPRDDYHELLELVIIVFGGCPPREFWFNSARHPAPCHLDGRHDLWDQNIFVNKSVSINC